MLNQPSGPKETLLMKPKEAKNRERHDARKEEGTREFCREQGPELSLIGCWGCGGPREWLRLEDRVLSWPAGPSLTSP